MQVLCGQCGKTIDVDDDQAGAAIACPECQHEIAVPRFDEDIEAEPDLEDSVYDLPAEDEGFADQAKEAMARKVQVVCGSCNRNLSVSARLSGKNARCPACGVKIRIPFPDEGEEEAELEHVTAAESEKTEQLDLASPEAEFARSQAPAPRKIAPKATGPSKTFWLGLGVAAAALIVVSVLVSSYVFGPGETHPDPGDGSGNTQLGGSQGTAKPPVKPAPVKTRPAVTIPKPVAKPTVAVIAEAFDDFAGNGYRPARLGQTYWHITAEVKAGQQPLVFRTFGPDVTVTVAGIPISSLGTLPEDMAPPIPGHKRTVALAAEEDPQKFTFVFEVPVATTTGTFKLGDAAGIAVKASRSAHPPPAGKLAGLYREKPPRNLKPLLRDPVMRALQATPDQKIYIHSRAGGQFQVAIPAAGVLGTAKPALAGVYETVLRYEDSRLPCKLRSCGDGDRLILYLSDQPFHQITYNRAGKSAKVPKPPRANPTIVRPRPRKPNPRKTTPKPKLPKPRKPKTPTTRKSKLPRDHGKKTIFDF